MCVYGKLYFATYTVVLCRELYNEHVHFCIFKVVYRDSLFSLQKYFCTQKTYENILLEYNVTAKVFLTNI